MAQAALMAAEYDSRGGQPTTPASKALIRRQDGKSTNQRNLPVASRGSRS